MYLCGELCENFWSRSLLEIILVQANIRLLAVWVGVHTQSWYESSLSDRQSWVQTYSSRYSCYLNHSYCYRQVFEKRLQSMCVGYDPKVPLPFNHYVCLSKYNRALVGIRNQFWISIFGDLTGKIFTLCVVERALCSQEACLFNRMCKTVSLYLNKFNRNIDLIVILTLHLLAKVDLSNYSYRHFHLEQRSSSTRKSFSGN